MTDTLYGLHTFIDAAAEPAGAVQVSAAASYVHPPMHCPFNLRFASVQHKGPVVGAAEGPVVGAAEGPVVGAAEGPVVGTAEGEDKSPNSPASVCMVSPFTADPPPCAS